MLTSNLSNRAMFQREWFDYTKLTDDWYSRAPIYPKVWFLVLAVTSKTSENIANVYLGNDKSVVLASVNMRARMI